MNLPEDNNFPLFKYSPEITSQFLIQTNQNLTTPELVEIPNISDDLLLTGLEDGTGTYTWTLNSLPPILLNSQTVDQDEPSLQELQPQFNEFLTTTSEESAENNTEIVLPLELSEKNFLTENGLFITNTTEDITQCELELVSDVNGENLVNQNEIQSSDVSSQETYIDINGLLIPQSNGQEILLNVENLTIPKRVKNKKKKIRQKIQKQSEEEDVFDIELQNEKIEELREIGLEIDNEPDSTTIFNDLDDTLNIDELATIVQTYQCKKCEFSCNKREEFLLHFKEIHYVVQKKKSNLKAKEVKNQVTKSPPQNYGQVENTLQLIINENGDLISNYSLISEEKQLETPNSKEEQIETLTETVFDDTTTNPIKNEELLDTQKTTNNCFEQVKIIYNDKEYAGLMYVQNKEKEKKIMRIKRKKKTQKNTCMTTSPIENKKIKLTIADSIETEETNETNEILNENESQISPIFLCATCNDQFPSVEECKLHYIEVHKYEDKSKETKIIEEKEVDEKREVLPNNKEILEKFFKQDVLKKRKHKCPVKGCPYRFAKIDLLKRHETCHINGTRSPFCCPECKEQFTSWRMCSIHLWKCHKVDIDFYTCPLCDYKGSTYDKLKHHIKIHSEDREYVCPDCGRDFKQPAQLRNHRVIHLDRKNMQNAPRWYIQKHCEMCGKLFADSKCLKKHIQAVHSKLKPFICNVCGHSCARKAMLQLHLRQHTGDKPYSCSICLYKTGDHNSLRRHVMRHTGDRPYKCPYCDYAAIQSNSYKNHLAAKHPGKSGFYKCTECSFKTVNEDIFYSHKNDHALGLLQTDKGKTSDKSIKNNSTTDTSTNNMKNTRQTNFKEKKNFEIEDDETQNCLFSSLGDITDEQTVDTGGITIPAEDPDDPDPIIV